ncbi:MAG: tRNA-dihydrouridine synthase [Eubacteriaceae bacterium]|nr:tRNA-dihydrouridine synthase [Eubacteriaceae bacterium]MDN5308410.1 tRNA-dihydrouridine synthase [Eubacteriaceae bacterium]
MTKTEKNRDLIEKLFKSETVPLFLGPMAGYTNLPYRIMVKSYGADAVVTEMISAKGLYYKDYKTADLMVTDALEAPAGLQIFGSDPEILGFVTKEYLNASSFDFLDFNAGCPAPKITKNGEGSALLKKPDLLYQVVAALVENSEKPVTVKTRIGWDDDSINIIEVAKGIEAAGAAVLFIHGRTREAYYSGRANWEIIGQVKSSLKIPVVLNGDICSGSTAKRALDQTGVDGLMIGRAAIGNPFIFRELAHFLRTGEELPDSTPEERLNAALAHIELLSYLKNEEAGLREMRKHLAAYIKGMPHATSLRDSIFRAADKTAVITLLNEMIEKVKS